jgi:hypothetical protein
MPFVAAPDSVELVVDFPRASFAPHRGDPGAAVHSPPHLEIKAHVPHDTSRRVISINATGANDVPTLLFQIDEG